MPPRKDYPPASRSSARFSTLEAQVQQTAATNRPLLDDSDEDQTQGDQSDETAPFDKTLEQTPGTQDQDNALPSIEDEQEPEFTDARERVEEQLADVMDSDEIRRLRQRIAELETAQDNTARSHREQSAFAGSGTGFKPKNMAAWPAFAPYEGENGKNPNYSANEKKRAEAPPKFGGKKNEFNSWLTKLADKFEEDDCTFRTEKSRMRYLRGLLEDKAEESIETRYTSTTRPYGNVAEMVQALESSFHDPNQSFQARDKLAKHIFRPGKKIDIHEFIAEFNSLCQKAKVAETDWKQMLWSSIPADLDNSLLRATTDDMVDYEEFCQRVASAAYSNQRAYEQRMSNKPDREELRRDQSNKKRSGHKSPKAVEPASTSVKPVTSLSVGRPLTLEEKKVHWENDTCFHCGKAGHQSGDCFKNKKVASVKEKQDENSSSSDDEYHSGKE